MTAAEHGFPKADSPSWLDLAKNVFDRQVIRWDTKVCEGGLRWQIFSFNTGYDYKNSASNGIFFQLAARLGAFTGNQTYIDWAVKSYQWTKSVGFVTDDFRVFDGADAATECSGINRVQWTYNAATFVYGSAVLYNQVFLVLGSFITMALIRYRVRIRHGKIPQNPSLRQWTSFLTGTE